MSSLDLPDYETDLTDPLLEDKPLSKHSGVDDRWNLQPWMESIIHKRTPYRFATHDSATIVAVALPISLQALFTGADLRVQIRGWPKGCGKASISLSCEMVVTVTIPRATALGSLIRCEGLFYPVPTSSDIDLQKDWTVKDVPVYLQLVQVNHQILTICCSSRESRREVL